MAVIFFVILKKGRSFLFLPFLLFSVACFYSESSGKLTMHESSSGGVRYFLFTVEDSFIAKNSNSPADEEHPKMTKAEADLLKILLKKQNYCTSEKGFLFEISSRQEKIYDITFAHLIEENYNARPISPKSYFGFCNK